MLALHPQAIHKEIPTPQEPHRPATRRKRKLYRKLWPKIRKCGDSYEIDGRKTGTAGKQEYRKTLEEAQKRAAEIEAEFASNGVEGLAMPLALRSMAIQAEEILKPFGKTILQAAQFYREHLETKRRQEASAIVATLADAWRTEKERATKKKLREDSLRGIRHAASILKAAFGALRIAAVTRADVEAYLDGLSITLQTRKNYLSLFKQFFNWCREKGHILSNPCDGYKIHVDKRDVVIWTPEEAERALRLCELEFPEFTLFHAIGLFAGLRPFECQRLTWDNVHFDAGEIIVRLDTSKVKDTRPVPIEPTLRAWLDAYAPPPAERKGLVVRKTNFSNRIKIFRARLGYRYLTPGKDGKPLNVTSEREWNNDTLRHSYGSYWLRKHNNRALLAENMGNSVDVIRDHYKVLVNQSDTEKFWSILPKGMAERLEREEEEIIRQIFEE